MSILEKIKNAFGKHSLISSEQLERLRRMPKDQARKELGNLLYDQCVKRTTDFVSGELKRADSPYRGMPATLFFHEVLAVTFWLMDRNGGEKGAILEELHGNYFRFFGSMESQDERLSSLMRKYERYNDTWNEITGHLDEFGLCVVQNIFGKEESSRTRERTFWIIQYADQTVNAFSGVKKIVKSIESGSR